MFPTRDVLDATDRARMERLEKRWLSAVARCIPTEQHR